LALGDDDSQWAPTAVSAFAVDWKGKEPSKEGRNVYWRLPRLDGSMTLEPEPRILGKLENSSQYLANADTLATVRDVCWRTTFRGWSELTLPLRNCLCSDGPTTSLTFVEAGDADGGQWPSISVSILLLLQVNGRFSPCGRQSSDIRPLAVDTKPGWPSDPCPRGTA